MIVALLTVIAIGAMVLEALIVSTLVLVVLDEAIYYVKGRRTVEPNPAAKTKHSVTEMLRKERIRREKEATAYEGFFEESYVHGFDSNGALISRAVQTPTNEALAYYQYMDDLTKKVNDAQIFDNTKEL